MHLFSVLTKKESFLSNNSVPLRLKKFILQSFVISKINDYAPLLGSNKKRTSRVQSLINTGILWCINSFSGKGNSSNKKNKAFHERNSYISLYALSRDLIIPPLAGICATQQIKCFIKWRNSNCIIRDLVRDIPTILYKKLKKNNIKKTNEINEHYWIISPLINKIKVLRYSNLQFKNSTSITRIGFTLILELSGSFVFVVVLKTLLGSLLQTTELHLIALTIVLVVAMENKLSYIGFYCAQL
ncbi:hypothetical protein PIROE2DRAFT_18265 [Piromyces sp. E2]|nr:hypothetical protein PIROE2DRAFT_18265 [Piromyces sp. E2]|eukprot:OUM56917.1 hypothetical protein PIROE2DRAFT_18265 [Piromyces sp. E2]